MGDHVVVVFVFGCLLVAILRLAKEKFGKEAPAPLPTREVENKGPSLFGGILFLIIIVIVAMGLSSLGLSLY